MKNRYRNIFLVTAIFILILLCVLIGANVFKTGKVKMECFVYDPCGGCFSDNIPCKPCKVVLEAESFLFDAVDKLGLKDSFDIRVNNTMYPAEKKLFEKKTGQRDSAEYPVLIVGNSTLYGWASIKSEISDLLYSAAGKEKEKDYEADKYTERITDKPLFVYFEMDNCRSCEKTQEYLSQNNYFTDSCRMQVYNLKENESINLFKEYCKKYKVIYENAGAPMVFIGDAVLEGYDEIKTFLKRHIENKYGNETWIITKKQ